MSVSTNAVHVGVESTYGTAVTPTRSYRATADSWEAVPENISVDEMVAGNQTKDSKSMLQVPNGGTGQIPLVVRDTGLGLLLKSAVGTSTIAAPLQTHSTSTAPASDPLTVQIVRAGFGTSSKVFTHSGCSITKWSLEHSSKDVLKGTFDFHWASVDTATAAATPAYSDGDMFHWRMALVELGGNEVCAEDFKLEVDNKLDVDIEFLKATKVAPTRTANLEASGSLGLVLDDEAMTQYANFLNDTETDLSVTWTNTANSSSIKVILPKIKVTKVTPQSNVTDKSMAPFEYMVVNHPTEPAVKVEYSTADTAY